MDSYGAVVVDMGRRVRQLRLVRNLQQRELAARAGVGTGTIVRLERTGRASVENLLRVAAALGVEAGFEKLFEAPKYRSIDEALERPKALERRRVRRHK
jgi:transcriptional regulator with XRE-family HTH domain